MTEHEYIQNILYNYELMRPWYMDFVTVFFAYSVASHLFGHSLHKSAALAISSIYTMFSLVTFMALVDAIQHASELIHSMNTNYPDAIYSTDVSASLSLMVALGPLALAWLASIFYLHVYVRKGVNA